MADQISIRAPKTLYKEGSNFVATVALRLRSTGAASTPTTLKYRIDCKTTQREILDWTTLSASSSASITVTGAQNAIQSDVNDYEWKQLTVMADENLSTQCRETFRWRVENLYGSP